MSTSSKAKPKLVVRRVPKSTTKKKSSETEKKPTGPAAAPTEVFARWKSGARINELVKEFKLTRPAIRRQLLAAAGGREAFKALRQQGAGGTSLKAKIPNSKEG